jgi:hypothetical protein
LFLDSSNVHWVFYATIGSLTRVLAFEQAAWAGRLLAWGAVAAGWVSLSRQLFKECWSAVWSITFFLGIAASGNLSGEWLIGGVEAKTFAYAGLFFALSNAAAGRSIRCAIAAGLATSFHPVVGGWGVCALLFAILLRRRKLPPEVAGSEAAVLGENRTTRLVSHALAVLMFVLCSLPGMIPAVGLILAKVPPEVTRAADRIQVLDRLAHHLDPSRFTIRAWSLYAGLLALWIMTRPWRAPSEGWRLMQRFVLGTLLIAAAGMVVGFGPRWPGVLKFYPFRLADLFLPVATALVLTRTLAEWLPRLGQAVARRPGMGLMVGHFLSCAILVATISFPTRDQNPTRWTVRQHADWRALCQWMNENTAADALCLTPRLNYTFRWYAERAEFATWKDCPQDARSLVAWKQRLGVIEAWRQRHYKQGFTAGALAELRELTGIDYVVAWYVDPYREKPVFHNRSFRVYRIPSTTGQQPAAATLPATE